MYKYLTMCRIFSSHRNITKSLNQNKGIHYFTFIKVIERTFCLDILIDIMINIKWYNKIKLPNKGLSKLLINTEFVKFLFLVSSKTMRNSLNYIKVED